MNATHFGVQARQIALRRVGRGGLGEAGGVAAVPSTRAGEAAVSHADVIERAGETEEILKIIAKHLKSLKGLPPIASSSLSAPVL